MVADCGGANEGTESQIPRAGNEEGMFVSKLMNGIEEKEAGECGVIDIYDNLPLEAPIRPNRWSCFW